jgi:hypothetical protein
MHAENTIFIKNAVKRACNICNDLDAATISTHPAAALLQQQQQEIIECAVAV